MLRGPNTGSRTPHIRPLLAQTVPSARHLSRTAHWPRWARIARGFGTVLGRFRLLWALLVLSRLQKTNLGHFEYNSGPNIVRLMVLCRGTHHPILGCIWGFKPDIMKSGPPWACLPACCCLLPASRNGDPPLGPTKLMQSKLLKQLGDHMNLILHSFLILL